MDYLTTEQRLEKICRILVRGIYIYAKKEGFVINKEVIEENHETKPFGEKTE